TLQELVQHKGREPKGTLRGLLSKNPLGPCGQPTDGGPATGNGTRQWLFLEHPGKGGFQGQCPRRDRPCLCRRSWTTENQTGPSRFLGALYEPKGQPGDPKTLWPAATRSRCPIGGYALNKQETYPCKT